MSSNRRKFLKNASQLTAGLGLLSLPVISNAASSENRFGKKRKSAADTINIGLIGCHSMGWADLMATLTHDHVACLALCDVDSNVLHQRASDLQNKTGKTPILYSDYRKLLENKDIDAVIIGTPDHWHCLIMIAACAAGKDVYVEKPISNSVEECNLMVAAKNKYNRIVQVGQWQRSDPHWIAALDYVHSGKLGKIRTVKTWANVSYGRDFKVKPDGPVPAGVDYTMWLGPAPARPFNPNRFHGSFRYFWDYAGGLMTDWGVHMIDMALAGMNVAAPKSVSVNGGKFGYPDDAAETPDTIEAIFDYGDFNMTWSHSQGTGRGLYNLDIGEPGVAFIGNDATLVANRLRREIYPEVDNGKFVIDGLPPAYNKNIGVNYHTGNFLECIRSRKQPNSTIEIGRNAALVAQLGNIAYKTGSKIYWDESANKILDNEKANDLLRAKYHNEWKLPVV
jgi:predicted dehydrogenase